MTNLLALNANSINGFLACNECETDIIIKDGIPAKCRGCGASLWGVNSPKVKVRTITNYSRKTPAWDRYGNLWFLELTSGAEGEINIGVSKTRWPKSDKEYMPLKQFFEWAKKRRIRGLGYKELFGPNAAKYGRTQYYGN